MQKHRCPQCTTEAVFSPVLSGRSKCANCHAIVANEDLRSLQHDFQEKPGDMTGEDAYG